MSGCNFKWIDHSRKVRIWDRRKITTIITMWIGQLNNYHIWFVLSILWICRRWHDYICYWCLHRICHFNSWKHKGYLRHLFRAGEHFKKFSYQFSRKLGLRQRVSLWCSLCKSKIYLITHFRHHHLVDQVVRISSRKPSKRMLITEVFVIIWFEVDHCMHLLRTIAKQTLEVTDESVDITFPGCFQDDVFVVVISQSTRQLFVVHLGFVFPVSPPSRNLVWIDHLELPTIPRPSDEVLAGFICKKLQQKLPQLNGAWACEARTPRSLGQHTCLDQWSSLFWNPRGGWKLSL